MNPKMTLLSLPLINLWKMHSLIVYFAILNIKIRFKGTYLGFLWTGLEPLLVFILLYTVFTSIRISERENFAIYLLTGIILYHIFSRGTLNGLGSIRSNRGIIQSLTIRRELFPVVATLTLCILTVVEIGVFFGLMPFFNFIPSWTIVLFPLVLLLLFILVLGFSYFLSIISIYVRDIQIIWAIIIHALFFISPIFWYVEEVEGLLLIFHKINPLGQIIEIAHQIVVFGNIPPISEWLYASAFVLAILAIGYVTFQKFQGRIIEEI